MSTIHIETGRDGLSSLLTFQLQIKKNGDAQKKIASAGSKLSTAISNEYLTLSKQFAPEAYSSQAEEEAWEDGIDSAAQTAGSKLMSGWTEVLQDPKHTSWLTKMTLNYTIIEQWRDLNGDNTGKLHFRLYPSWAFTLVEIDGTSLPETSLIWLRSDDKDSTLLSIEYQSGEWIDHDTALWRKVKMYKVRKRLSKENGSECGTTCNASQASTSI